MASALDPTPYSTINTNTKLIAPDYEKHGILCYLEHSLCGLALWMTTTYGFIIFSCSFILWIGHIGFTFFPRGHFLLHALSLRWLLKASSKVLRWQFTEDLFIFSEKMSILSQLLVRVFGHKRPRSMQAVSMISLPRASILIARIRKCHNQDGESPTALRGFVWWYSHVRQLLWTQAWCFKQQHVTLWDTTFALMAQRNRSARRPLFFLWGKGMTIPLYLKSY